MTQILTQKDIDALWHGDAASPPATVTPWNLARPAPMARRARGPLDGLLARAARGLQDRLSSRLQASVEVALLGVEQVPCAEFLLSLENPCVAFRTRGAGGANGVIDLGRLTGFHFVDRLLGGEGGAIPPPRTLTVLEQGLARTVAADLVESLCLHGADRLGGTVEAFESDPERLAIAGAEDAVTVAHLELRDGGFRGVVALAGPSAAWEPAATAGAAASAPDRRAGHDRARIVAALGQASLAVSARFPALRISARALGALRPGQVIHTQMPVDGRFEVLVNGRLLGRATMGQVRRQLSVRVESTMSRGAADSASRPREGRIA